MLHQQLTSLDDEPLDGGLRWLVPTLVALAAASGGALFFILDKPAFAGLFVAGCVAMLVAAFAVDRRTTRPAAIATLVVPDHVLVGGVLDLVPDAAALTRADGQLVTINRVFADRFGEANRIEAISDNVALVEQLTRLRVAARRDGSAQAPALALGGGELDLAVTRAGSEGDLLLWHFAALARPDLLTVAAKRVAEIGRASCRERV